MCTVKKFCEDSLICCENEFSRLSMFLRKVYITLISFCPLMTKSRTIKGEFFGSDDVSVYQCFAEPDASEVSVSILSIYTKTTHP
jgi:hypothetical protein